MNFKTLGIGALALVAVACSHKSSVVQDDEFALIIDNSLQTAEKQAMAMAEALRDSTGLLPRTLREDGSVRMSDSGWWCSGFFPGVLWYLYENSGDKELLEYAREYTSRVEDQQYTTDNHDVGFMINCSFGNGYRLTGEEAYKDVMLNAAKSLSTRYTPETGLIRSWDHHQDRWNYPVIIDNMMNLELLLWAAEQANDTTLKNIALSHADKTLVNHFRPDYSTYHVVSYNPATGEVEKQETFQGYADDSTWARGEAWALYGYTMMYDKTGDKKYLEAAEKIASFIINHPNMPADGIPYWDFDAPDQPNALRDASAAAIMSSALIQLSQHVDQPLRDEYLAFAKKQLTTLSSDEYLAAPGTNGNFILRHGVGHLPGNSEVDVPLTYADYYYVEALTRFKKLMEEDKK